MRYLRETRDRLLEKRRRRAERETSALPHIGNTGTDFQREQEGLFASPTMVVQRGENVGEHNVERTQAAQ